MFENQYLISLREAAHAIGLAEKTARNWLSAGKFPIKTVRQGRRRLVLVSDIEKYVQGLSSVSTDIPAPAEEVPIRRRGRPRKGVA